jgi:hypothetical protein
MLFWGLASVCSASQSSTVVSFDLVDLVKSADSIIIGTVEKNEISDGLDNKVYGYPVKVKIHCATIKVEKFFKRDLKKTEVLVCTTQYPNIDVKEFKLGKRYLVAIAKNADGKSYHVTGGNGVFSFENNLISDEHLGYFKQGTPLEEVISALEKVTILFTTK